MRRILKKTIALISVLALVITLLPATNVYALNPVDSTPDYLALGDSITTGNGLTSAATESFPSLVAVQRDYVLTNKAIDGNTAGGIYNQIKDGALDDEIVDAELITITCGGNDLMAVLYEQLAVVYNAQFDPDVEAQDIPSVIGSAVSGNLMFGLTVINTVGGFSQTEAFQEELTIFETNLKSVMSYIRSKNETATVVVLTQYNPYKLFGGIYASVNSGIDAGAKALNEKINENAEAYNYDVSDVYTAFQTSSQNLYNATTEPINLDFHPNVLGHQTIAQTVIETIHVDVTGVELSSETLSLKVDETSQLMANIIPDNATDKTILWMSDNEDVATVDQLGVVTAISPGTATITAQSLSGSVSDTCEVTVTAESGIETKPTDPTDSTTPTEPTDPTDSTTPTEPTDPTDSTTPTEPTDPTDSTAPTEPTDSTSTSGEEAMSSDSSPQKGQEIKDKSNKAIYKVTKVAATVAYVKPVNKKTSTVTIPATVTIEGIKYKVTSVEKNAFKSNKYIKKVTIGNNVKTIGANAFYNCTQLNKVKVGTTVTTIGDKAFYKCTSLKSITIPSKVTKIGKQAFASCKKLKTVTIKTKSLKASKIGKNAFRGIQSNATIKVSKSKLKTYKAILKKKGISSKAKFKKI